MKKFILTLCIILLTASLGYSQFNKAGRTVFQFLKVGLGARQTGMGEANIAYVQDANSIFWNPAGITGIQGAQASFNYLQWIGDIHVFSGVAGYNWDGVGVIVLNYISLDYGNLDEALVTSPSGSVDTRTGNTFSGSDLCFGIGIARQFTDKLSIGLNLKYVREDLYIYSADLFAFDVGTFYNTGWYGINLAMSAQNFSSQARWLYTKEDEQQTYELPLTFRIGVSWAMLGGSDLLFGGDFDKQRLTFNVDAIHTNDYSERLDLGLEYTFYNMLSLRGGYRINYKEGNLSLGAGIQYDFSSVRFSFDYTYVSYDFLQSPHQFSISLGF